MIAPATSASKPGPASNPISNCGPKWSRRPACRSIDRREPAIVGAPSSLVRPGSDANTHTTVPRHDRYPGHATNERYTRSDESGHARDRHTAAGSDRSGPATAIVVDDTPYLIDFGPGVIRRATAAYENGVHALGFGGINIKTAFLTHLHSDHTLGYPDLIFTPWAMGRRAPLDVYGPKGLKDMTENVLKAWQIDTEARINGINQPIRPTVR